MTNRSLIVSLYYMPDYWENFLHYCNDIAKWNDWDVITVIEKELKPHGKFIDQGFLGDYLRWDDEKYHTLFVLRWS